MIWDCDMSRTDNPSRIAIIYIWADTICSTACNKNIINRALQQSLIDDQWSKIYFLTTILSWFNRNILYPWWCLESLCVCAWYVSGKFTISLHWSQLIFMACVLTIKNQQWWNPLIDNIHLWSKTSDTRGYIILNIYITTRKAHPHTYVYM